MSSDNDELKHEHKCLECEYVPCVNFFRKSDNDLEGGESYMFKALIEQKISFPCNVGSLIYTLCKLWSYLGDFPSCTLSLQCIRDLRASAYLLLSCHYRSSIQLLRPIVENCVTGLYWDAKVGLASKDEEELVNQQFSDFLEDKYKIPFSEWRWVFPNEDEPKFKKKLDYDYCLSWMVRTDRTMIDGEARNMISNLVGELNKYLHSSGLTHMEIGKKGFPPCSSWVRYQKEEYEHCTELFQDVAALLMEVFYGNIEAEKLQSKEILEAIGYTKSLEYLEKDLDTKLVFSEQLRNFLSKDEFAQLA